MAGVTETITYDTFLTTTIKNYEKGTHKQFLQYRPAVEILFDGYSHKDTKGGRTWQGIVEYGTSPSVKFFTGVDTFGQEPTQTAQPIMYDWRYMGGSFSVAQTEALENSGVVALADIAQTRYDQVLRTMNLIIGNEIFSDGSHYDGKTFKGLQVGIPTNNTTPLGGLDPAVAPNTFWRNAWRNSCGSFAANGVNGTANDYVLNMWNNLTDGGYEAPSDLVGDQSVFEYYNKTNIQPVRYVSQVEGTADLSFRALQYQGRKWHWDRQCPTGTLYFLNRKWLHFKVDPRFFFKWTDPLQYQNQLAYTRIVGLRLCMVYTGRMFLGVQTGWTA